MTKIVVNHLTKMKHPHICVAGLDVKSNEQVRPVLQNGQLDTSMLSDNGGPFALGAVVSLGEVTDIASPPEVEDRSFAVTAATLRAQLSGSEFWKAIDAVAQDDLTAICGEELVETSRSFSTPAGQGSHSLGCYRPATIPTVGTDTYGKKVSVYAYMQLGGQIKKIPITDIRLVDTSFEVSTAKVQRLEKLVKAAPDILFSVGLSRPFAKSGSTEKRHWLQINNVFVSQAPLWK